MPKGIKGGMVVRLSSDMKTICSEPLQVLPSEGNAKGSGFEGHAFFEGSSIRKIDDKYYLVYCSSAQHELCYAISDYPDRGFKYGGVIISNCDLGYCERTNPSNYYGNNHGGILTINNQNYIFYHRHTHGTQFSRQGCAERITIMNNDKISQVEITSCGLNKGALPAKKKYPIYIICNLNGPNGTASAAEFMKSLPDTEPFLIEEGVDIKRQYLNNMRNNSVCGIKYIDFKNSICNGINMELRGDEGVIEILKDDMNGQCIGKVEFNESKDWIDISSSIEKIEGVHAIYFRYTNCDFIKSINIASFEFF